ncbi:MAG TPA: hypothetical protein PLF40_16400, partial [Kofleriaceae bacterium]|nr:hypothetical protein [Kofleriaceae bacterium]
NTGTGSDATTGTGSDATTGTGSDASTEPAKPAAKHASKTGAWIAAGSGIAFATVGAVLAMSAKATQDDLDDLLATRTGAGQPATFDSTTQTRYNDLISTGERYQTLSWVSFGLAGAAGIAATYLFLRHDGTSESSATARTTITPSIGRNFASVSATLRF